MLLWSDPINGHMTVTASFIVRLIWSLVYGGCLMPDRLRHFALSGAVIMIRTCFADMELDKPHVRHLSATALIYDADDQSSSAVTHFCFWCARGPWLLTCYQLHELRRIHPFSRCMHLQDYHLNFRC